MGKQPSWKDVKAKLAGIDKAGLTGLIQDLYGAQKENRAFLWARFGLGEDVLEPYLKSIEEWLAPDVRPGRELELSPNKARRAITDYQKAAAGDRAGLAELLVFYCETGVDFCRTYGYDHRAYYEAIVKAFGEALDVVRELPPDVEPRNELLQRLGEVMEDACDLPYDVGDEMSEMLATF